jgi:DNA polymerase-3 subunit delta
LSDNIGFSKDYNVFELRKALGERNQLKAYKIGAENFLPKIQRKTLRPRVWFQLLKYHDLKDKTQKCGSRSQ